MNTPPKTKRNDKEAESADQAGYKPADKSREGGDDALSAQTETDTHADEKVIVNEQKENKAVNAPSQTAALPSESEGADIE